MTRKKPKLVTLEVDDEVAVVADEIEKTPRVVKKRVVIPVNHDVLLPRSASRYVPQMR